MDMQALKKIAFEEMAEKSSHSFKEKGNKYTHGERVAHLAVRLRKIIFSSDADTCHGDTHDDILTAAAWFHDIRNGIDNHAQEGAKVTRALITPYCSADELEEICGIIHVHDDRHPENDNCSALINLIKLHQDADLLDHFGTFDIWSTVTYSLHMGQTINEARDWMISDERMKDNEHFRALLNYDFSRKIYDEKVEFYTCFSKRFDVELCGGIWNEDNL